MHYPGKRIERMRWIQEKSLFLPLVLLSPSLFAQQTAIVPVPTDPWHKVVIAGKQYQKSSLHDIIWGRHYRKEWGMAVTVPILRIDSIYGGLKPVEKGGGRQTRNLRLEDSKGKQYVLRSIDKTYKRALPEEFSGTFIEDIANDQVSVAHPFAPFTVPLMAEAAGVFHTNPKLFFLPDDKKLGEFNEEFKNQLYLLEERPDSDQHDAPYFGNAEDVIGTEKMMENVMAENKYSVDQSTLVRARLFDMFLSDWGRHEDQWRWGVFKKGEAVIYKAIPRDRDQTYTRFDGLLVSLLSSTPAVGYLQSFDFTIKDVSTFNFLARHLDRRFLNELSRSAWIETAKELQRSLTDAVIENAVRQMPPEVFPVSGAVIIAKLKSRRDHLVEYANDYYSTLAKEVDVPGSKQNEIFEVSNMGGNVKVEVFNTGHRLLYRRIFIPAETKEIRIYGIDGNDRYAINGPGATTIRIIGGPRKDEYTYVGNKGKVLVYDDRENTFNTGGKARLHLSSDSAIHKYNYTEYKVTGGGIKPALNYNVEDRLYVSLGYRIEKQKWRKDPFASRQDFSVNYSLLQKAFSTQYKGTVNQFIGKWNLGLLANYDAVRDVYFVGVGNNTVKTFIDKKFFKMRSREINTALSLSTKPDSNNKIGVTAFFKNVRLLRDEGKFLALNQVLTDPSIFDPHSLIGATLAWTFDNIDQHFIGRRGIKFSPSATFEYDLSTNNSFARLGGETGFYLPITRALILAVKAGGLTVTGTPPIYELAKLGGGSTVRGHFRYRYYGKSSFFNQNELQWNIPFKSWVMNGTLGVLGFLDEGRVWQPGEVSDTWHTGYGFGLMIAPFNKLSFTASYGMSREYNIIHFRVGRLL